MRLRRSFLLACRSLTSTSLALLPLGSKWFCRERNIALDGMFEHGARSQSRLQSSGENGGLLSRIRCRGLHQICAIDRIFGPSAFLQLAVHKLLTTLSVKPCLVRSGIKKIAVDRPKAKTSRAKILATSASARGAHAPRAPRCPFLALSGRANRADECPPWGNNRRDARSAHGPFRKSFASKRALP